MGVMAECGSCFSSVTEVLICPPHHHLDDRHLNANELLASNFAPKVIKGSVLPWRLEHAGSFSGKRI